RHPKRSRATFAEPPPTPRPQASAITTASSLVMGRVVVYFAADAGLRATAVYVGRGAGPVSGTAGAHWPSGVMPGGIRSISRKNLANCSRDRSVSGMLACELYLSVASACPGSLMSL